jgi:hypothetical protein
MTINRGIGSDAVVNNGIRDKNLVRNGIGGVYIHCSTII